MNFKTCLTKIDGLAANNPSAFYPAALALILALLTAYRILALQAADLQLYFDEAYYWGWSREPAFGYYSKPPMIAWVIRASTSLCGDGEVCIRAASSLLFMGTAWLVYSTGKQLFDVRTGFYSALVFALLPVVSFYSWLMTTDVLLFFFWALALFGWTRALARNRWRDWLLMGVAVGGGLLSKYTMLVFPISALACLIGLQRYRPHLANPKMWSGFALALLIFLPNLLWNFEFGFVSFRHTTEVAQWHKKLFHPDHLLAFLAGQTLLFGPVLSAAFLYWVARARRSLFADDRNLLLAYFAVPLLALYSFQALASRANLNWAAAIYVAASVLAASVFLSLGKRRILAWALVFNLLLGISVFHYGQWANHLGFSLSRKTDIYSWMKGWRELGRAIQPFLARHPDAGLLSDNRRLLAELVYYIEPHPDHVVIWNPSGRIADQFTLTADLRQSTHERFIFVVEKNVLNQAQEAIIRSAFATVEDLGPIKIPVLPDYALEYRILYVEKFLGYPS